MSARAGTTGGEYIPAAIQHQSSRPGYQEIGYFVCEDSAQRDFLQRLQAANMQHSTGKKIQMWSHRRQGVMQHRMVGSKEEHRGPATGGRQAQEHMNLRRFQDIGVASDSVEAIAYRKFKSILYHGINIFMSSNFLAGKAIGRHSGIYDEPDPPSMSDMPDTFCFADVTLSSRALARLSHVLLILVFLPSSSSMEPDQGTMSVASAVKEGKAGGEVGGGRGMGVDRAPCGYGNCRAASHGLYDADEHGHGAVVEGEHESEASPPSASVPSHAMGPHRVLHGYISEREERARGGERLLGNHDESVMPASSRWPLPIAHTWVYSRRWVWSLRYTVRVPGREWRWGGSSLLASSETTPAKIEARLGSPCRPCDSRLFEVRQTRGMFHFEMAQFQEQIAVDAFWDYRVLFHTHNHHIRPAMGHTHITRSFGYPNETTHIASSSNQSIPVLKTVNCFFSVCGPELNFPSGVPCYQVKRAHSLPQNLIVLAIENQLDGQDASKARETVFLDPPEHQNSRDPESGPVWFLSCCSSSGLGTWCLAVFAL
ncbi:hypothetical protein B0H10DRAFT_1954170 [Mycena sp. CBHHK59/15]|nr:hypothetical protein B0H10DRAFT_1954170 [Mycena sp. CBHHK59/15]